MVELEVRSPVTEELIKTYRKADDNEIMFTMRKARTAFSFWRNTTVSQRLRFLGSLRNVIIRNLDEIAARISLVTGKVRMDALLSDIYPALEMLRYYEANGARLLKARPAPTPGYFRGSSSYIEYGPLGVVLVISPWNQPFQMAMVPLVTALAAGNTIILKPSEQALDIGKLISVICRTAGLPEYVVQVVYGNGDTGKKLIEAGPDKVFFTGSSAAGREVMAAAARSATPLVLELGANNPMLVFADANFERAVRGAAYGALANSGQSCLSVGRVYVQETIYDRFLEELVKKANAVRVGHSLDSEMGALTTVEQIRRIEYHIADALKKGAKLLTPIRTAGHFMSPIVLKNVHHGMKIMKEETFGPVIPVMQFKDEDEAVELANDSTYGLAASVWTGDIARGRRIVSSLQSGTCMINNILEIVDNPHLPFGGVRSSGFGRYHAADGLYAFCRQTSVMVNDGRSSREANWFPYTTEMYQSFQTFLRLRYGKGSVLTTIKNLLGISTGSKAGIR